MTWLNEFKVKSFKGLNHLDLEFGSINLITGRNNTGKTSLLEAISLYFQPERVRHFRGDINTLININSQKCKIQGIADIDREKLVLRPPEESEQPELFHQGLSKIIDSSLRRTDFAHPEEKDSQEVAEVLATTLQKHWDNDLKEFIDQFLVIETDEEKYTILENSAEINNLLTEYDDLLRNTLEEELDIEIEAEEDVFGGRTPLLHLSFLEDSPESKGSLSSINTSNLDQLRRHRQRGEKDAIKIDDIEDYLKEKNLVENLKSFDLEKIVLEHDGEKEQIPFRFMGSGFQSIVMILWELFDERADDAVVLMEEPENHMHPGYIEHLVKFLIKAAIEDDLQLFITTHDLDFIREFFDASLETQEEEFLESQFKLFQMGDNMVEQFSYNAAEEHLKNLKIDLRGT
ncbi:MAG: AAA family ATPase [Halobacteriaceae archaeon]